MKFYQCRDCKRLYDLDIDKCIECGSDDWRKIKKDTYIKLMAAKLVEMADLE